MTTELEASTGMMSMLDLSCCHMPNLAAHSKSQLPLSMLCELSYLSLIFLLNSQQSLVSKKTEPWEFLT